MKTFFQIAGICVLTALLGTLMVTALLWFLGLVAIFVVILGVGWAAGMPIKVTQNGQTIGHIKRTKFYPLWSKH